MKLVAQILTYILTAQAKLLMARYQPTVVAVTGSVGKTTTKDMIAAVLSSSRYVRYSAKSLNSDIGIPLAIMGRSVENGQKNPLIWIAHIAAGFTELFRGNFPEIVVLEVGAGAPGDIVTKSWLYPHVSVFTALAETPVHIENFADRQDLFNEKKVLAAHTRPTGTIIYNSDDQFLPALLADYSHHKITVGMQGDVSVMFKQNCKQGVEGAVTVRGIEHPVMIPGVLGHTYMQSFGVAMAVAMDLGLDTSECVDNFAAYFHPNPGRMRILRGIGQTTVIDDSYNASPASVHAALEALHSLRFQGRKIFLFGDMKELGSHSRREHLRVGDLAYHVVDILVCVGTDSQQTADQAIESGMRPECVFQVETSKQAGELLLGTMRTGDVVLAKSSRHAIKMEQALVQLVEVDEISNLVQEYL